MTTILGLSGNIFAGGYTPGNPFDVLIFGYYQGERLLYAAKVRNGFVPHLRREVAHYLISANDSLQKESVKSL
jgi:hypothetical protein